MKYEKKRKHSLTVVCLCLPVELQTAAMSVQAYVIYGVQTLKAFNKR